MASNKRVFTLRLSDEVFDKIGALATKQHRSMTNYIELSLIHISSEPETIAEKKLQIGNAIEMFYELVVETISLFAVSNDAEILMTLNAGMKRYRLLSDLDDKTLAEIDDMTLEELDFVVLA